MLQERRRALDARIVETIESRHGDRLAEHVERLAHHAFRGGVWDKAVTYSRQAAARVLERSAARQAVAYAEQALQALAHVPESGARLALAVDLRLDLRNSLILVGDYAALGERLREAEALATELDDRRRTALLSGYMTHYCWITGELRRARTYAERLEAIVGDGDELPLRIAASYYLGIACFSLGEFPQSVARYWKMLETIGRERQGERFGLGVVPAAMAYAFLAQALAAQGDFDGAIAHGQEGVGIAQAADHPYSVAWTTICLGIAHNSRGSVADALRLAERSAEICREWGYPGIASCAAAVMVYARGLAGHPGESLGHLPGLVEPLSPVGGGPLLCQILIWFGEMGVLADRPDQAESLSGLALATARERGERAAEGWALWLQGEVAARGAPARASEAGERYGEAFAVAHELGMRPLRARSHLGLGRLHARLRKHAEARADLAAVAALLREMGMRFWLDQAEAELARLG